MSDPMKEIRISFFIECEELLENLFDSLQNLADGESSTDTINIAFRAVHSIKGGAGAFALDALVDFAHHFETAMDKVRSGALVPDAALMRLFFRCGDTLSDLVRLSREGEAIDRDAYAPVLNELRAVSGAEEDEPQAIDFQPMTLDLDALGAADNTMAPGFDAEMEALFADLPPIADLALPLPLDEPADAAGDGTLRIVFRPAAELYASGNEPLFLLRQLADLGLSETELAFTPWPDFGAPSPDGSLSWTIRLQTPVGSGAVDDIFEFVDGLCALDIAAEAAALADPAPAGDADPLPDLPPEVRADPDPEPPAADFPAMAAETAPAVPADTRQPSAAAPEAPRPAAGGEPGVPDAAARGAAGPATVRVDIDRIDRLVNLVGELVINQAMLSQSVAEAGTATNAAVARGLDEFLQLTRDIQDSVMMIRAQPVKPLFQRMSRIVREASAVVGKSVRLVTDGEATEIDKTVIERLADPLTHMVRNAVDHGLETPEARLAAGKPGEGVVRLTAAHRSGRVAIEVADDGAGINRPKVRQIAIDKGLIPADTQLTDADIDNLLFLPGFSTASEVSSLSGRGVGMDVVKSAIAALGGRITISSVPGAGTVFAISLPLTLAVLDGMVVRVARETLVVPLSAIAETLTIKSRDIERLGHETSVLSVRGYLVPLLDLGVELGYRAPPDSYDGAIALLVAQEDGTRAALVVDSIEDQRQVVIKGLQDSYGQVPGVAAATILGNGRIALILDAADLCAKASGRSRAASPLRKAS